jgi:hypothetical protein
MASVRQVFHDLQHERRLADSGLSADQNCRTVDDPAAQNPIDFRNPGNSALTFLGWYFFNRDGLAVKFHFGAVARLRLAYQFLGKTIPAVTRRTFAQPFGRQVTTVLTKKTRFAFFQNQRPLCRLIQKNILFNKKSI